MKAIFLVTAFSETECYDIGYFFELCYFNCELTQKVCFEWGIYVIPQRKCGAVLKNKTWTACVPM